MWNPLHNFSALLHLRCFLLPYTQRHSHIFLQFPRDYRFHHVLPSQKRWLSPESVCILCPAIFRSSETNSFQSNRKKTLAFSRFQSDRFDPHTSLQNRRTILLGLRIHTMTRASGRLHFQAETLLPIRSAHFQIVHRTGFLRNNNGARVAHTQVLHNLTTRERLPAPVRTARQLYTVHETFSSYGVPSIPMKFTIILLYVYKNFSAHCS